MIEKVLDAEVTPLQRDAAIRKVNDFLMANYPCQECEGDECDELDEAAAIVEIVESTAGYIRWENPTRRPWPTRP